MFYDAIFDALAWFCLLWFVFLSSFCIYGITIIIRNRKAWKVNYYFLVTTLLFIVLTFIMTIITFLSIYETDSLIKETRPDLIAFKRLDYCIASIVFAASWNLFLIIANHWWFRITINGVKYWFGFFDYQKGKIKISKKQMKTNSLSKRWIEI